MASLLLIDLSAIFWAKWHSAAGKPIDTAYNYTMARVRQLAQGYDRVAVCCDVGKSFRAEIDSTYKANRPPKDPAALGQVQRVCERLEADAFCILSAPGFEADDVIATTVRWARSLPVPFDVTIAGCDKDLLQLIEPGVRMHNVNTDAFFGPDEVAAKFEVTPDKVRDVLALAGDTSDNIKGIDGVGWKTAAKLVNRFGDLRGIRAALDANPEDVATPALRQSLLDQWSRTDVSTRLVTLTYEVPIDCGTILEDRQVKQLASDMKWDGDEPAEFANNGPSAERVPEARPTPIAPAPAPEAQNDAQLVQRPASQREIAPATPAAPRCGGRRGRDLPLRRGALHQLCIVLRFGRGSGCDGRRPRLRHALRARSVVGEFGRFVAVPLHVTRELLHLSILQNGAAVDRHFVGERHEPRRNVGATPLVEQALPKRGRRHVLGVGVERRADAAKVAEAVHQLRRRLPPNAIDPLDVVRRVTRKRQHVANLVRGDFELGRHFIGTEERVRVDVVHAHAGLDELQQVLVASGDRHVERDRERAGPSHRRRNDVVRFESRGGQDAERVCLQALAHALHLTERRGILGRAIGLVRRVDLGAERLPDVAAHGNAVVALRELAHASHGVVVRGIDGLPRRGVPLRPEDGGQVDEKK
jgi:5'-3' exonuclease